MRVAWTYVAIIIGAFIGISLFFIAIMDMDAIIIAIPMGALNALLVLEMARLPVRTSPLLHEKDIRELAIKAS
jgi:hypothetical protein